MSKNSDLIRKYALANAFTHGGKANPGAIIGKLIAEDDSFKKKMKEIQSEIQKTVQDVNALSVEDQEKELQKTFPEFFEEKPKEKLELPELPNATEGKVVTRLAPEPNGYLHIGHSVSFFFNEYYARKYKGKLILRFEDTNPEKEEKEYYDSITEDLEWLGIEYDERKNNSDDMETFYKYAEKLLTDGAVYGCTCDVDTSRALRREMKACDCRDKSPKESLAVWDEMLKTTKPGEAAIRFKGDMDSKNSVMRDPTLFRIVEAAHPLQGTKYRVWPLYDFANAIEDAICGVTHVLRSAEFIQRDELQNAIRDALGLKSPETLSYSRTRIEGSPTSKRDILKLIEDKTVTGWDDPRLVTIKALKRRGILPKTLQTLAYETRLTRSEKTIDWNLITATSRKILDADANRYSFVPNPVKLEVSKAPKLTVKLKLHPDHPDRGSREVKTSNVFYIPESDSRYLNEKKQFRLKDLYNVAITSKKPLTGDFASKEVISSIPKLQWVSDRFIEVEVQVPDVIINKDGELNKNSLTTVRGYGEESIAKLKVDDVVQFERFGFVRIESVGKKVKGILAHK